MARRKQTRGLFTITELTEQEAREKYGDVDALELYLRAARELARAHQDGEFAGQSAELLAAVRAIEADERLNDPVFRSAFGIGYGLAQRVEQLLANEWWSDDVAKHRRSVGAIRKVSQITADDLREAERLFKTRPEQAAHLDISTRYLRWLRSKLLK